MSVLATKDFWAAAGERAAKSFAGTILSVIGLAGVTPADVDWKQVLLAGGFGALVSVLMSVSSVGAGNPGPSLTTEELKPPVE